MLQRLLRLWAVGSPCRNGSGCAAVDQLPWGSGQAPGQVRGMRVRSRAQAVPPGPPSVRWEQPGVGDRDQVSECRGLGPPGRWAATGLRPLPPLPRSFQPAQHQPPEGCPWEASPAASCLQASVCQAPRGQPAHLASLGELKGHPFLPGLRATPGRNPIGWERNQTPCSAGPLRPWLQCLRGKGGHGSGGKALMCPCSSGG